MRLLGAARQPGGRLETAALLHRREHEQPCWYAAAAAVLPLPPPLPPVVLHSAQVFHPRLQLLLLSLLLVSLSLQRHTRCQQ